MNYIRDDQLDVEPDFYRSIYPDLKKVRDEKLVEYYRNVGAPAGHLASKLGAEPELIKMVSERASVLEIGPFCNPKVRGANAFYFDVEPKEALIERAKFHQLNYDDIPDIDFVSDKGDLSTIDRKFDAVFSSHAIEHQPSLVHHLNNVADLLTDDGIYAIVSPDKRYCFDHFLPTSKVYDVLDAYLENRTIHTAASFGRYFELATHNDPHRHWAGVHGKPGEHSGFSEGGGDVFAVEQVMLHYGTYADSHAWQFTPDSFAHICNTLSERGILKLKLEKVYPTLVNDFQFFAIMKKA